jgi:aspartyl-tRNA synthetase
LVYNGFEIVSGSLRIYQPELQQRVFETIGLSPEEAHNKFGFLLEAFEYGTPPHGGLAYGLESAGDVASWGRVDSGCNCLSEDAASTLSTN